MFLQVSVCPQGACVAGEGGRHGWGGGMCGWGGGHMWLGRGACIGGSRGGVRPSRPPWASKFFRFHAVFGKIWRVHAPPGGFTPPLGKILDPPLACMAWEGDVWLRACMAGEGGVHGWRGGMCGWGGGHAWLGRGHMWLGACMAGRGVCMAGEGGVHGLGACVAGRCARQILWVRHTVNEQAVRILLKCILVFMCCLTTFSKL